MESLQQSQSPLQLGGIANDPPQLDDSYSFKVTNQSLQGCISKFRINKQVSKLFVHIEIIQNPNLKNKVYFFLISSWH